MRKKILTSETPSLRRKSKKVSRVDKKIIALVKDMKETLRAQKDPEGVGLAAPQIGKNLRIFVVRLSQNKLITVINPKVLSKSKKSSVDKKEEILEGCLSIPNLFGPLKRAEKIRIEFLDEKGKKITKEFVGMEAQIVQHEIDHLDGILFVDKLLARKKPLYKQDKKGEWVEVDFGQK